MALDNRTCFLVNLRDGLRCRQCGRGPQEKSIYHRGFGYHHMTPRCAGGADDAANVVLLCRVCHDAHHAGSKPLNPLPSCLSATFACAGCGAEVDPAQVLMNCGWYQCPCCIQRIHLFDHFGFSQ